MVLSHTPVVVQAQSTMPRQRERCPSENRNNSGEEVPISEKKTLRFNGSLSLGHNYVNDLNSARFLWKQFNSFLDQGKPGLKWWLEKLEMLWHHSQRDVLPCGTCRLLVELYTKKMLELLLCAYSTVNIQDTALLLGMNDDDATNYKFLTTQSLAYDDINTFLNQNNIRGKIKCAAMGLECGLNFSNANCERLVCCDGTEIRSQQIATDFKYSQICLFYWINSLITTDNKGDVEAFHALQ
ncbi:unnamed protein product [Camellia sinensis]